jgi:hypothetical protein
MSAATLCPNLEQPCDDCIADFIYDHPGVEPYQHTLHLCECPWVAWDIERDIETCVGCGKPRDLVGEWEHFWAGRPKRAAA